MTRNVFILDWSLSLSTGHCDTWRWRTICRPNILIKCRTSTDRNKVRSNLNNKQNKLLWTLPHAYYARVQNCQNCSTEPWRWSSTPNDSKIRQWLHRFRQLTANTTRIQSTPTFRLSKWKSCPSTFQRTISLRTATEATIQHFLKIQVCSAVRTRFGPGTSHIHGTPLGSHFLAYHPEVDQWDGSFALIDNEGETWTVVQPALSGPTKFYSTVVKRFQCTTLKMRLKHHWQQKA